jgi:hypothetical protein
MGIKTAAFYGIGLGNGCRRDRVFLLIDLSGGGPGYWEGRRERDLHSTTLRTLEGGQELSRERKVSLRCAPSHPARA